MICTSWIRPMCFLAYVAVLAAVKNCLALRPFPTRRPVRRTHTMKATWSDIREESPSEQPVHPQPNPTNVALQRDAAAAELVVIPKVGEDFHKYFERAEACVKVIHDVKVTKHRKAPNDPWQLIFSGLAVRLQPAADIAQHVLPVSYTHLRAHET